MKHMYGLAIVLLANIYQLYEMKKSWNMTQKNVAVAYQMAQEQCQLDQWRFCESPRYYNTPEFSFLMEEANLLMTFLWVSQQAESIPHFVGSTTTWIWIHDNRHQENHHEGEQAGDLLLLPQASTSDDVAKMQETQLRSETMRHRRLTEESFPCTHKSSPFPDLCLYEAWMKQGVRRECSRALNHLQSTREMQNLHKWMCQTVLIFVCAMWFGYAVWMLFRIMKRLMIQATDACSCCSCCNKCCSSNGCCCCSEGGCCSGSNCCCCSGDDCCNSMGCCSAGECCSGKCCCSAGACCNGKGCCHETKCCSQDCCCCSDSCCCCSERKQASNRDAQGADICICCCCKTSSDNPFLGETCCNCCNGTGLCSAACASCCGGGSSSASKLPTTNDDETLIRILVV
ncbi:hypothetical protein FisN_7Hh398 [Fistulifera solaris]|uniref:Uncharacterized protein n=1 Tax=Fistulifera solaris TaxID=1519565 RepID=A0A1Z5KSP6_FISSO|nr:hypothetical protein FisN_7Hh398 [Fistulifera solaris]|eukprot:GAX29011.1 hypothetical protein FisN_7Hh398 [Fistulifera solaris]